MMHDGLVVGTLSLELMAEGGASWRSGLQLLKREIRRTMHTVPLNVPATTSGMWVKIF
jgi:hypothetical protein